jgi:predicted amidohydrolase
MTAPLRVAIAQAWSPLTMERALEQVQVLAQRAADAGAAIIAFPEAWIPGYPVWLDICRDVAIWEHDAAGRVYELMVEHSLDIASGDGKQLRQIAREMGITMVIGATECVNSGAGKGTLYNSLFTIGADGNLLNHHRKLMPTHGERLLWGIGDTEGLRVVDAGGVRLGGLICWEHWMPLARQALHVQGEAVHIAAWPTVSEMHVVASRHYAFEARCFVLACGSLMRARDLPSELEPHPNKVQSPEQLVLRGGSCVIAPDGSFVAEPLYDEEKLIVRELDLAGVRRQHMTLDVTGHYSRDDSLELSVRKTGKRTTSD